MFSIRCCVFISIAWMMIAIAQAKYSFATFWLSGISGNLSFFERLLDRMIVRSALECSVLCRQTSRCNGYMFRATNKTCQVFSLVEASVTRKGNPASVCTSCTTEETAEQLIWKLVSKNQMKAEQATEYLGCYLDGSHRRLNEHHTKRKDMTLKRCIETCRRKGFKYAGTENGNECFCGNSRRKCRETPETDCNSPCYGNRKQTCGGYWRISLFKINF